MGYFQRVIFYGLFSMGCWQCFLFPMGYLFEYFQWMIFNACYLMDIIKLLLKMLKTINDILNAKRVKTILV